MERLTERTAVGILVKENYEKESLKTLYSCYGEKPNSYYSNCEEGYCAMQKLADYEDAEEQGRLVKLPCKVGDTVWKVEERLEHTYIQQLVIDRIEINDSYIYYFADEKITGESVILDDCDFSKTVFLTKSEAEAKLKELRGGKNGKIS